MPAEVRDEVNTGQDSQKSGRGHIPDVGKGPDGTDEEALAGVCPEQIANHMELLGWTLRVDPRGKKS